MNSSEQLILRRHRKSLYGVLRLESFRSRYLEIKKSYYIYKPEPPVIHPNILFLLRGHEREWVHFNEDNSRVRSTIIEDIDKLIHAGRIPPLVIIMPGLNSSDNTIPSLGLNMCGSWPPKTRGLGTGLFRDFLIKEFIPYIELKFGKKSPGVRLCAGFSLGGFTALNLSLDVPGYFHYIGIYDGLLPWLNDHDPRLQKKGMNDAVWLKTRMFNPSLGLPRNKKFISESNPFNRISNFTSEQLHLFRTTKFFIKSASGDGMEGNRDRSLNGIRFLKNYKIPVISEDVELHKNAKHNWHWNDYFLLKFLSKVFGNA